MHPARTLVHSDAPGEGPSENASRPEALPSGLLFLSWWAVVEAFVGSSLSTWRHYTHSILPHLESRQSM